MDQDQVQQKDRSQGAEGALIPGSRRAQCRADGQTDRRGISIFQIDDEGKLSGLRRNSSKQASKQLVLHLLRFSHSCCYYYCYHYYYNS